MAHSRLSAPQCESHCTQHTVFLFPVAIDGQRNSLSRRINFSYVCRA